MFGRIAIVSLTLLAGQTSARAEVLITPQEALLPAAHSTALTFRGVTRAPKVEIVSPGQAAKKLPLKLQVKFQSYGGADIDPASIKVTYLKNPAIDLTPRVKPFAQAAGIDMPNVELPPGNHDIRVDVKDSAGRAGFAIFTLKVAQ